MPIREASRLRRSTALLIRDPAWAVFVFAISGLLALCLVGIPLAIAGVFHLWVVVPPTLALWLFLAVWGFGLTATNPRLASRTASMLAILIATSFTVFAASNASEHLLTDRDPAVYFITGRWLASEGDLLYTTGLHEYVDETSPRRWPQGIYGAPEAFGYFQFQHAPAVVMATAHRFGGDWLMFRSMAIVAGAALLGIYLLSSRLVGPRLGLLPLIVAAVHPAFLHIAKDGYSEYLAMAYTMGALWLWTHASSSRRPAAYFACGLLLGAPSLARIDGWLVGLGFVAGVIYLILAGSPHRRPSRREVGWLLAGFSITAGLGLVDLLLRSPLYLGDLAGSAIPMIGAFLGAALVSVLISDSRLTLRRLGLSVREVAPIVVTLGVVVTGLYGLLVRPHTVVTVTDTPLPVVAELQRREGLPIEPARVYGEMSVEWLARYQGTVPVVFAFFAIGAAAHRLLKRADPRVPLLTVLLAVAGVYLWRPSITPDHLWAMRRFVPVLLPLGFVTTTFGTRILLRSSDRVTWRIPLIVIVLALTVGHAVIVGWPVARTRTQVGVVAAVEQICDRLPPGAVVLFDRPTRVLAGVVRTSCRVPVTSVESADIVSQTLDAGFTPVSMSASGSCPLATLGMVDFAYELPERTLSIAPAKAERVELSIALSDPLVETDVAILPEVPADADAVLLIEIDTTWAPENGSSVVVTIGGYLEGMWIEYRPNGVAEVWVATDDGFVGTAASPRIDDGETYVVGGYVTNGMLYSTCGSFAMNSVPLQGMPVFSDAEVEVAPVGPGEHGNQPFVGDAAIITAVVDPNLVGQD